MRLTLSFNLDNQAFDDCNGSECASILEGLAHELEVQDLEDGCSGKLHDSNGNNVGQWKVTGRR
jgi:hypothetical protein